MTVLYLIMVSADVNFNMKIVHLPSTTMGGMRVVTIHKIVLAWWAIQYFQQAG